jgi:hypothetical protein
MKPKENKKIIAFLITAVVLLILNTLVWTGVQNGQLTPIENSSLWVSFAVLNIISLLWAFSLLGLHPAVLALSYTVGGFIAFQSVQGVAGIGMAEASSAGATYGAFGAMVVGHATTKNRLGFFRKEQVPYVFLFVGLLLLDGLLNSRVCSVGQSAILNVLIVPLAVAGIAVGLIWLMASRLAVIPKSNTNTRAWESESIKTSDDSAQNELSNESSQLIIQMPNHAEEEEESDVAAMLEMGEPEPVAEAPSEEPTELEKPVLFEKIEPEEPAVEEHFFPLDIDKDDDFIEPYASSELVDIPVMNTPDLLEPIISDIDCDDVISPITEFEEIEPVSVSIAEPNTLAEESPVSVEIEEEFPVALEPELEVQEPKAEHQSEDWLNGHLDLLSKINTKD